QFTKRSVASINVAALGTCSRAMCSGRAVTRDGEKRGRTMRLALSVLVVALGSGAIVDGQSSDPSATGTISGRVSADRGEVRAFRVRARDTIHRITYTVFTTQGAYRIFNLPPSTYDVQVLEDAYDSSTRRVEVAAGAVAAADLALTRRQAPEHAPR